MEEVLDEVLLRITAQFVAEREAGLHPRLDDYMRRYPQYAEGIADFVAYYYALEAPLPEGAISIQPLSLDSHAAIEQAWKREEAGALSQENKMTLLALARQQHYSLLQLAEALDLNADIVEQMARRQIDPATLPHELLQRLTGVLAQSMKVVHRTLGIFEQPASATLAERRTPYELPARQTFRQALLSSEQLSPTSRECWLDILEQEGL
ncbi:MAG TPA: hypothetical protein VFN35_16595 [Ktedonobacteraceae bacterium]|nr:hypothetical protein [Ktedonobacteraceae bacterium]